MVNLEPASQDNQETSTVVNRAYRKHLLLFILASVLIHSLGLLIFGVYDRHRIRPNAKEKTDSKPIEFVVVPPEESKEKPPPETQKRSTENSVAEKNIKPEKTAPEPNREEVSPKPTITSPPPKPPEEPTNAPKIAPAPPTIPKKPFVPPEPTPAPQPQPESTKSPVENQPPILSGSDTASILKPKPESEPAKPASKPTEKDPPVATRLPPQNEPSESILESDSPPPITTPSKPTESSGSGAASLLEGDYQRTLANGGGDAFFSPEALNYESVLDPSQLDALKHIDLGGYFAEVQRRVKPNWNPSFAVEEYTTILAFDIQKNGQITGLRVTKSSGSERVDRESLEAVQNSAPFAPLPPEFPLDAMKVKFTFNIYIY